MDTSSLMAGSYAPGAFRRPGLGGVGLRIVWREPREPADQVEGGA